MKIKIKYNSPVILTYGLISLTVLLISSFTEGQLILSVFSLPGRGFPEFESTFSIYRLFTYIAGHANWGHLAGNFTIILLIGPVLEEKYGSFKLLGMIFTVALVTGLIHVFLSGKLLFGASGIVFMLIILSSFTNMGYKEIPLTMILVIIIFFLKELVGAPLEGISQLAHITGGVCGAFFGFFNVKSGKKIPEN